MPFSIEIVFEDPEFPWRGWKSLLESFGRTECVQSAGDDGPPAAWMTRLRNSILLSERTRRQAGHVVSLVTSDRGDPAAIWAQLAVPYLAARNLGARPAWRGRPFEDPEAYRRWAIRMLRLRTQMRSVAHKPPWGRDARRRTGSIGGV